MSAYDPRSISFDDFRKFMGEFISTNPNAGPAWDLITCLRGPDFPSEKGNMSPKEAQVAYRARRARKYRTVEVIRSVAFFGSVGGAARHHSDEVVILPPRPEWDHFDRHVARAANVLGLTVMEDE